MVDMELFELMKVTLKEVLRAELITNARHKDSIVSAGVQYPSDKLIADRAFEYAIAAKRRLERHRPSAPAYDQQAPTLHPAPRKCENSLCLEAAIDGSDFCGGHQY